MDVLVSSMENEKEGCGEGGGGGDGPLDSVVEDGDGGGCEGEDDREQRKRVGLGGVLPGVDEEAVEAAECGEEKGGRKQGRAEDGLAGDCRDEGGGGETDAYGEFLRVAV